MAFVNYDYSSGLASLGQGVDSVVKGFRERADTDSLLKAYDQSRGGVALASLGQSQPMAAQNAALPGAPQAPAMPAQGAGGLSDLFAKKEAELGLPTGYLQKTAAVESSMNPNAKNPNSSAGGLFQFIDSTAKQYGLANKFDPIAATDAAARLAADNKRILMSALGREPTAGELYLAHQQGAGGAVKLLANANAPAEAVVGSQAARLNGGGGLTAGQMAQKWTSKIDGGQPVQMAQAAPQAGAPMADVPASGAAEVQGFAIPGQQPAQVAPQRVSPDMIRGLLANPGTRDIGKQLWAQTLTGKSYGFQMIGDQLFRTNPTTGTAELVPGITNPKATLDQRKAELDIQKAEKEISGTLTPEQEAQKIRLAQAGRTQITNTMGAVESEYAKANGKAISGRFEKMVEEGDAASQEAGVLSQLRTLGGQIKNMGSGAALQAKLAEYGIKVGDNVSEIEAYGALIDKMVPQQKVAGAGSTSDFDAKMFKGSLPGLMRTPGGNEIILSTLEALNTYKRQRADVVSEAMALNEKPSEVLKKLKELPDPFAAFKASQKAGGGGAAAGATPAGQQAPAQAAPSSADGWQDMGGGIRIREKR